MKRVVGVLIALVTSVCLTVSPVWASSYNQGSYNENIPYGSLTYIAINTSGTVSLSLTPTVGGTQTTGDDTVTVTSTDVNGYQLFLRSDTTTDMDNGSGGIIPTSGNGSPATLAADTWGYNTTGSTTDFVGSSLTDTLIKTFSGLATSGDDTTVTYGINVDLAKPDGTYTTTIVYSAVPDTD